jgi:WD40 repeat protein
VNSHCPAQWDSCCKIQIWYVIGLTDSLLHSPLTYFYSLSSKGASIDFSEDGNRLVVGSPTALGFGQIAGGSVRTFDYDGSTWVEDTSKVLYGDVAVGEAGWSVALSPDGRRVISGSPYDKNSTGKVMVGDLSIGDPSSTQSPTAPPCAKKNGKCKKTKDCCKGYCIRRKCVFCVPDKSKCKKSSECCKRKSKCLKGKCSPNQPRQGKNNMKKNGRPGTGPKRFLRCRTDRPCL